MNSCLLILLLVILAAAATISEEVYDPTDPPNEQDQPTELSPDPDDLNSLSPVIVVFWFNLPLQTEDDQKDIQDVPIPLEKIALEKDEPDINQKDNLENLKRSKRAIPMLRFNSMRNLGSSSRWNSFRMNRGYGIPPRVSGGTQTQSTWGSKLRRGFEFTNAGLKPLSRATTILSDSSGVVANIFNMYQTSMLTSATVKAQEAQVRANNLVSDLNQVNINQKRADIKIETHNLENQVEKLRREVKEIEGFNVNASEGQRFYNNKNIEDKNEEIKLKLKEIEIYKGI